MDKCRLARAEDFTFALHFCTGAESNLVLALSFGTYTRVIVLPLIGLALAQATPASIFLSTIASPFLSWSFQKIACTFFPVPFFLSRLGLKYRKYFKPCWRICQVFFFCLRQNVSQEKTEPKKFFLRFGLLRQSLFRES